MTTEYPPSHGGGISTYCRCTAEMLAARGVAVTVIVSDDSVGDHALERRGENLLVVRFNAGHRGVPGELGGSAGLSYAFLSMLRMLADKLGVPDVIESQDYLGIAYYLQQSGLLGYEPFARVPVMITLHAPAFVYLPYNRVPVHRFPEFWTGEMEKQSIRAADMVVSPSEYLVEEIGRHMDFGTRKPVIMPYAYEPCGPSDESGRVRRNKIVYYGKLSPQKGSFRLLEYFRGLWEDGFPHALHVIGGTDIVYQPEQLTMGQVIRREYAGYIRQGLLVFQDRIVPERIARELADAHVVVLPSIVDNLPFACLETMACGKIVLASVQGGQREIIRDGENGFLFDHEVAGDFARQLTRVLALSAEAMQRIAEAAQRTLQCYRYEVVAPKKIALLERVARLGRPEAFPFLWDGVAANEDAEDLLSVVIPFYNLGGYLQECIASVLAGSWRRLEILVVNDGSTEPGSLEALDGWRDHPGVTVIDQPNRGLAAARNAGAGKASGRYLAFLDADDKVAPGYYSTAIGVLKRYRNVHFVGCWVRYFGDGSGLWPAFNPVPPYLLAHNPVNSSGLVYKTVSFLAAGLNDPRLEFGLEDYESVISLVSRGFNGVVLPEALHFYRVRAGSMIRQMNRTKLLYSHGYIAEKHREYYRRFATELVQLLNSNGPSYLYENPTTEVFVTCSTDKPGGWRHRVKRLARRNKTLKTILLVVLKKTERLWQRQ